MMDINKIYTTIKEIEDSQLTHETALELASLYIIKAEHEKVENNASSCVVQQYKDILPSYIEYVNAKRRYQLGELDEQIVLNHLENLCQELSEFLDTLYCDTDIWKERKIIKNAITNIGECYDK